MRKNFRVRLLCSVFLAVNFSIGAMEASGDEAEKAIVLTGSSPNTIVKEKTHEEEKLKVEQKEDFAEVNAKFLATYTAYTAAVGGHASRSADASWNESSSEVANALTDQAWEASSGSELWSDAHEKALEKWHANATLEEVIRTIREVLDAGFKEGKFSPTQMGEDYAKLIKKEPLYYTLNAVSSIKGISPVWEKRAKDAVVALIAQKQKREIFIIEHGSEGDSESFFSSKSMTNLAREESKEYVDFATKKALEKIFVDKGINKAIEGVVSPGALKDYLEEVGQSLYENAAEPLVDIGLERVFSFREEPIQARLPHIPLNQVIDGEKYQLGEKAIAGLTLSGYLRKLNMSGASLIYTSVARGSAEYGSVTAIKSLLGEDKEKLAYKKSYNYGFRLKGGVLESVLKETMFFALEKTWIVIVPNKPLQKPVGVVKKDGETYFVYSKKILSPIELALEEEIKKHGLLTLEKIHDNQNLVIGDPVISKKDFFSQTSSNFVEFSSRIYMSLLKRVVKESMVAVAQQIGGYQDNSFGLTDGKKYRPNDGTINEAYLLVSMPSRRIAKALHSAISKWILGPLSGALKPVKYPVAGILFLDGEYRYVFRVKAL